MLNGKVLITGGGHGDAELFDPQAGSWEISSERSPSAHATTATLMPDGKVLVTGKIEPGSRSILGPLAELYDPDAREWINAGRMATPRNTHTSTLLPDGRVLIVGGNVSEGVVAAELYIPAKP